MAGLIKNRKCSKCSKFQVTRNTGTAKPLIFIARSEEKTPIIKGARYLYPALTIRTGSRPTLYHHQQYVFDYILALLYAVQ